MTNQSTDVYCLSFKIVSVSIETITKRIPWNNKSISAFNIGVKPVSHRPVEERTIQDVMDWAPHWRFSIHVHPSLLSGSFKGNDSEEVSEKVCSAGMKDNSTACQV